MIGKNVAFSIPEWKKSKLAFWGFFLIKAVHRQRILTYQIGDVWAIEVLLWESVK